MLTVVLLFAVAYAKIILHDQEREAFIEHLNNIPNTTWTAKFHDRWRGQPLGASKTLCGVKKMLNRTELVQGVKDGWLEMVEEYSGDALPDSFDSVDNWPDCADVIGEIRDQSACGCCWAFGAAEAASDRLCINTKAQIKVPLSAQDTCFCAERDGCNGGMLDTAWRYIKNSGLVTGGMYDNTGALGGGWCSAFSLPHCHHHGPTGNDPYPNEGTRGCPNVNRSPSCPRKCDSAAQSPHNNFSNDKYSFTGRVGSFMSEESIMETIKNYGPVEAAFTVYSDFENYSSGVYQHTGGSYLGGHAIRIVGWGTDNGTPYWKVANSWNPYWGEDGYFRIVRGQDECGIESQVMATSANAVWGKK